MRALVRSLPLAVILALAPNMAFAYIDPGLISTLFQGVFALLFGGAAAFIFRPWESIRSLFKRSKSEAAEKSKSSVADADEFNRSSEKN